MHESREVEDVLLNKLVIAYSLIEAGYCPWYKSATAAKSNKASMGSHVITIEVNGTSNRQASATFSQMTIHH